MVHPLLQLLLSHPGLLAEHAAAYTDMFCQELGVVSQAWRKRLVLATLGLCCAVVSMVLAGVALLLWATGLVAQGSAPWVIIATPLVPGIAAWWCWMAWRAQERAGNFDNIMSQMRTDMVILRQAYLT